VRGLVENDDVGEGPTDVHAQIVCHTVPTLLTLFHVVG
jgi:hypothetical protein